MAKYSRRKNGLYVYQYRVGYDSNGKRVMRTVYGRTVTELEAKIRDGKRAIENHATGNIFLADYCREYVELYKASRSENTRAMYDKCIRYQIEPLFEGVKLRDLTTNDIQKAVNRLGDKRRTAEVMLGLLRQVCRQAQNDAVFARNPCQMINLPQKRKKAEKRALSASEREKLRSVNFTDRENAFVFLLYGCGLRREEALGLRIRDVDLDAQEIRIRQVVTFPENSPVVRPCPKNGSSVRTVPLPASCVEKVRAWYNVRTMSGADGEDLLFPNVSKTVYMRFWRKIIEKLDSPTLTAHIFRHNYATMLYYSGVTLKQAAVLLGHSSTKMILDIYAHLDDEREDLRGKIDSIVL